MFFPCSSGDDDVVDKGCDTRQALKRLVHLLLEFVLHADNSEWQSKKSVSAVGGHVRRLWTQLQLPVSRSGVQLAEELGASHLGQGIFERRHGVVRPLDGCIEVLWVEAGAELPVGFFHND